MKNINKLIRHYVLEIVLTVFIVAISIPIWDKINKSDVSNIANSYATMDYLYLDIDKYVAEYFSDEKKNGYSRREYSFFLGYYTHLLTDIEWSKMAHSEGVTKENAEKENMSYTDFVWKVKKDWYDLDFLYLEEHPDFRAFHIYEDAEDVTNVFMDPFPRDAFEDRRKYICGFYHSDNHGDLHRDYRYLTKERADRFVTDTVDKILKVV